MNMFSLLDQAAQRFPDLGAVFRGKCQELTFAELHQRSLMLGAGLRNSYAAGTRIAIYSENVPEYVEVMFGIWAAGMVATPINSKLHPFEAADILDDASAELVIVSDGKLQALADAIEDRGSSVSLVGIGSQGYHDLFDNLASAAVQTKPEQLAWLFFTSGTTGRSKGAMLSHQNLMMMTLSHLADMDDPDTRTSLVHAAPMSHGSGLYMPAYVARGARQVVPVSGGFDTEEFMQLCEEHPGVTAFFAPTMIQRLRLAVEAGTGRADALRKIIYGGGPMYLGEINRSLEVFGPVFVQIYGLGESPMTITGLRSSDFGNAHDDTLASVGWPRSGAEVKVADADGKPVPTGEIGEVIVRGGVVMQGYWNNEAATADAIRDGWLWTGDMGSFDASGTLTLRDRSKDMIVTGGTNVYPREVEEVLFTHPDVEEVSVIGLPDEEWGEIVVAVVVAAQGKTPCEASLNDLCNARIARFKRPKRYVFISELPKNNYGKVVKRQLREQLVQTQ